VAPAAPAIPGAAPLPSVLLTRCGLLLLFLREGGWAQGQEEAERQACSG
jgi:hypothetical protein